ncbi:hypothetical protein SAMN02799630_02171 [Paenibacillus sp. UNCCL117]|uniref:hypothetical protein n=1 Tax=unclassified Paenibacillus TaxID=185978 RepID=UPI00088873FC|nr:MULTISPECIES: hypothetical protein [unclassified Paenibacillus]SDD12561.1 hypothetical protein SAMN04488602_10647 [Paenibacillus sp. cl123]SFW33814.1 hypothetical protein SAMN02799630_02171 [Paenibacillus sp. UNCCL117]
MAREEEAEKQEEKVEDTGGPLAHQSPFSLSRRLLGEELGSLNFQGKPGVLRRTHPGNWRQRVDSWWNREIELPLLPIGVLGLLVIAAIGISGWRDPSPQHAIVQKQRQLIEVGGSVYWRDYYEKAVAAHAGQNQD